MHIHYSGGVYMQQEIQWILLDQINPLFEARVSKAFIGRMCKTKTSLQTYDLLLAVEKTEDSYILVSGFDRYSYLRNNTSLKEVPCIVEESGSDEEMHLKVLRRFYPRGDTTKENKKQSLVFLQELGASPQHIVDRSCMTMREIKNDFSYDPNIPVQYINDNTVPNTLNEIERLEITTEAKYRLYYHAGLNIGNPNRLTGQVMSIIKQLNKDDTRVQLLTDAQQSKTFDQAFNPTKTILNKLKNTVSRFMPYGKTS